MGLRQKLPKVTVVIRTGSRQFFIDVDMENLFVGLMKAEKLLRRVAWAFTEYAFSSRWAEGLCRRLFGH